MSSGGKNLSAPEISLAHHTLDFLTTELGQIADTQLGPVLPSISELCHVDIKIK